MSVEMRGVRLEDVFRDADGDLWEVVALCDQPTATFRRARDQKQVSHVIGCPNMRRQFPGEPLRGLREEVAHMNGWLT